MLRYHLSLFHNNTFQVTNRYFIAASTQHLYSYLLEVDRERFTRDKRTIEN